MIDVQGGRYGSRSMALRSNGVASLHGCEAAPVKGRSAYVGIQKFTNDRDDLCTVGLEREVAGIKKADVGVG